MFASVRRHNFFRIRNNSHIQNNEIVHTKMYVWKLIEWHGHCSFIGINLADSLCRIFGYC